MKNSEVAESFYYYPHVDCSGSNYFVEDKVLYSYGRHFPVAIWIEDYVLLNGDTYSPSTSTHQSYIRHVVPEDRQIIIPFSALNQAVGSINNYNKIKVIESIVSENIPYEYKNSKGELKIGYHHTLGGSVFKFEDRYFISGIDPTGVNNLYFLTELVRPVDSFEDAIEALKPEIVRNAEQNEIEVKRQGEWFFIKTDKQCDANIDIGKNCALPGRNNDTGHHIVSDLIQMDNHWLVRGIVKHDRKEHRQLKLYDDAKKKSWWIAIHNEQIQSWSAGGNVD